MEKITAEKTSVAGWAGASSTGGRRVRVEGEILVLVRNPRDLAEFLCRAGLGADPAQVAEAVWIAWRGVGPERWGPESSN
ncbi:hypothetical protein [Streptomyces sp. NPDC051572]|uniref:hypothetical protein n=1 Tax=Streptomyces sp. NPDC051572 TaxID=3155802 RepID=UPI00344C0C9F